MKGTVALVFAGVACAVLSGCGLTSSPADDLTFTAPTAWHSSPGIMGFMQFWTPSEKSEEVLMLFRSPKQIDREQILENGKLKDVKFSQEHQITICGNEPAMFFKGSAESSTGNQPSKPHSLEMTIANAGSATYFAMYVYPLDGHPNAQAESALRELCVKK
ncbi:MAG TPA: hypothetical protein VFE36_06785 [Candidatus Baltobacteraceae bacterium]|jgi:hypothetical protein|nr:hypothetical protein [Candidatus Baltobacteraceae bacterium]